MAILAIDIGGTKTTVGVYLDGELRSRARAESQRFDSPLAYIDGMKAAAHEALRQAGGPTVDSIGIGCGGPLDRKAGKVLVVPNLPGWDNTPLTAIFGDEFGVPAYLDNDVTVAALAELTFGVGRGVENSVFINIGTGVGGGIVIGGRAYRGSGDNAGEFGHHKIVDDGPPCPCGDRGCLEALASGTGIARRAREVAAALAPSQRPQWAAKPEAITGELVARQAGLSERLALQIWMEAMGYLGIGVANVVNILNPELVILGGGVADAGEQLVFEPVRKVVAERAMPALAKIVRIVPSALGENVGVLGAVALAMEQTGAL